MSATLVLNKAYLPINIVDFKKVAKYLAKEQIEIISAYEDKYLRTWNNAMNAPAIVRLVHFLKPPKNISRYQVFSRRNVWERDEGKCQYCGTRISVSKMTFDHVIPKDQGGHTRWDNIVTACTSCNIKKANKTPEEAGMILRKKPKAPRIKLNDQRESRLRKLKYLPHQSWKDYIYWNVKLDED
ncbi:MAG: HNH endonuclease [Vallitaleaceae bacterium]|nr:HNH endonuclease [Vallitaleaceae bacterium]